MNPAVAYIVKKLKKQLVAQGGTGYHALQRRFRIMDDDNSRTINYAEFKKGITELGLRDIANSEVRELFSHFGKLYAV
jgi:calcyphosin